MLEERNRANNIRLYSLIAIPWHHNKSCRLHFRGEISNPFWQKFRSTESWFWAELGPRKYQIHHTPDSFTESMDFKRPVLDSKLSWVLLLFQWSSEWSKIIVCDLSLFTWKSLTHQICWERCQISLSDAQNQGLVDLNFLLSGIEISPRNWSLRKFLLCQGITVSEYYRMFLARFLSSNILRGCIYAC